MGNKLQDAQEAVENDLREMINEVPEEYAKRFVELLDLLNIFCLSHLDDEYRFFSHLMSFAMCQSGSPIRKGKPESWAAGIIYTIGQVNFLTDPNFDPHMTSKQIAEGFGISKGTMQSKAKIIREGLDIHPMDTHWTLPSNLDSNPLIWMVELENGMINDIRNMSREIQVEAYERGLIPYIPADMKDSEDSEDSKFELKLTSP